MTLAPFAEPPGTCSRCSDAAGSLHFAVGTMMAAASHARRTGNPKLAAELRHAYTELLLILTPPAASAADIRRAA